MNRVTRTSTEHMEKPKYGESNATTMMMKTHHYTHLGSLCCWLIYWGEKLLEEDIKQSLNCQPY